MKPNYANIFKISNRNKKSKKPNPPPTPKPNQQTVNKFKKSYCLFHPKTGFDPH